MSSKQSEMLRLINKYESLSDKATQDLFLLAVKMYLEVGASDRKAINMATGNVVRYQEICNEEEAQYDRP